jgi:branched-subunit amino acid aminotransferase/4-amino-4-deoxychorismate lyase
MANVFSVTQGRVQTPDLSTGARSGVVREWVMRRVQVEETLIARAGIATAEELFLTSSWLGVMPVASVDGRQLKERKAGAQLLEEYRNNVERR